MRKFVFAITTVYLALLTNLEAQTNTVKNFSFEAQGSNASLAQDWNHSWSGYERAYTPTGRWDGYYALKLNGTSSNLSGAVQRINFNQTITTPILITTRVKGEGIADWASDKYGAVLYCRVLAVARERAYFSSVRKVEREYNPMGTFPYDVKIQEVNADTSLAEVNSWLNQARLRRAWVVIVFHKIRGVCPDHYCVSSNNFSNILTAVQSSTLPVVTYEQGLDLVKSPR